MRICFPGGARYSQQLDTTSAKKFKALSQLGDLFVIGFSLDLRPRYFVEHAHFYLLPKWSLPVMRYLTMFTVGPWLVLRLIWRHGVRVLIAKSPYEGLAAAWAKVIACWFACHVVLIVESHGDFEESLFLQRRVAIATLYRFLMRAAAGFALRHADLLRAVSTSTQEQLQRWAPGKPVVRFVTWTDIEVFLEAGTHDGVRQPEIVYAGVLIPRKGVHHLIHAFHRIAPDFRAAQLVIIGRDDNPEYAAGLRATVRQLGLDGRVHFLGGVPQGELARWMGRAQVFVLPSYSEGLPRVVFEAMAAGMPVIATRVSGIPDIVQQDMTGFLVPCGDEAALIERLRWVLAHPAEANSLGQRARDFARTFFQPRSTWTTIGGS
ncbi:glycosyltransferase [Candidatus Methylomirabilis sp.]|uniref:glycosyltransferase n=1 Tax=Candidatus Methylomirabilis sp. TaxID=2032687 RepID=UPI0030767821